AIVSFEGGGNRVSGRSRGGCRLSGGGRSEGRNPAGIGSVGVCGRHAVPAGACIRLPGIALAPLPRIRGVDPERTLGDQTRAAQPLSDLLESEPLGGRKCTRSV